VHQQTDLGFCVSWANVYFKDKGVEKTHITGQFKLKSEVYLNYFEIFDISTSVSWMKSSAFQSLQRTMEIFHCLLDVVDLIIHQSHITAFN
jgi:hypothetical protein